MPAWTLADICSKATTALGNRSDIALSIASFWANDAMREVLEEIRPSFTDEAIAISSTSVNEDKISLPSDFHEMIALSNLSPSGNPDLLAQVNTDQLASFSRYSGVPTEYALFSTWLELRPIPDSAYSIEMRYYKQPSEMTATTAVPSVATRYRRGIFLKTKELLAQNVILDSEAAAIAHNEYVSFMNSQANDQALRVRNQHYVGCSLPRSRGQKDRSSNLSWEQRID
jgi:hypothetical protein